MMTAIMGMTIPSDLTGAGTPTGMSIPRQNTHTRTWPTCTTDTGAAVDSARRLD